MAPNATGGQRGFRGRKTNQSRRDYLLGGDSKSGDSDSAVPLLRFGAKNNWLCFKEKLSIACTEKFGDLGRLIDTGEYWVPPIIKSDDFPDWETNEIQKVLYLEAEKARAKLIRSMEQDRSKMYSYIISKLSKESLDEYKHHQDYDLVSTHLSVKGLWVIFGGIHALNTSSSNQVVLKKEAFNAYVGCK